MTTNKPPFKAIWKWPQRMPVPVTDAAIYYAGMRFMLHGCSLNHDLKREYVLCICVGTYPDGILFRPASTLERIIHAVTRIFRSKSR